MGRAAEVGRVEDQEKQVVVEDVEVYLDTGVRGLNQVVRIRSRITHESVRALSEHEHSEPRDTSSQASMPSVVRE